MLHRGHLQESIAKFLICTQLGRIRDVTPLVVEITYLNTADYIILWSLDWDGGGFWRKYFVIFPFSQWHVHTTVYKQNLIGTQGLMVDKKQIKSNESIWKEKWFRLLGGLDLRFSNLFPTIFTTGNGFNYSKEKNQFIYKTYL